MLTIIQTQKVVKNHQIRLSMSGTTVNSLLTDAPNSGLTRYSGHSSMHGLISLYYSIQKKLPTNGLSSFRTADTSD